MSGFDSYSNKRVRPLAAARPLRRAWAFVGVVSIGCATLGCATRELPAHYPAASAASPEAKSQAPWVVTRSLSADPPLPGERTEGWEALESGPSTGQPEAPHEHPHHGHPHHGHPHHGQPQSQPHQGH